MRRLVLVDSSGTIVATAPHPQDLGPPPEGAPTFVGFAPGEGEQVHEMTLPPEVDSHEALMALHTDYLVKVGADGPSFAKRAST